MGTPQDELVDPLEMYDDLIHHDCSNLRLYPGIDCGRIGRRRLAHKPPRREITEMNWLLLFMCAVIAVAAVWVIHEIVLLLASA